VTSALVRGAIVGFCVAAPVGPIGLLCIHQTLTRGRSYGFVAGLGAATADALYGVVAGFGFGVAQRFLVDHALAMRLGGAAFLTFLGVQALRARPTAAAEARLGGGHARAWVTTLALTLSNPMTMMSFAAMLAGNLSVAQPSPGAIARFVLGVFVGSAAWWLTLALLVGALRGLMLPRLRAINVLAGVAILGFAFASLWSVVR
jgi:threonine/homoserine/homoserine lactone efflux protein